MILLAACGGAGPQSIGNSPPPTGGGGTGGGTGHTFVDPTEAKSYTAVGSSHSYQNRIQDPGDVLRDISGNQVLDGNGNTTDQLALLLDADSKVINYKGKEADDIVVQLAAGPELKIARYSSISLQAVGLQRWYGGRFATREYGGRFGYQQALSEGQKIGVELDARRTESQISDAYSGWQLGANATYEHLVSKSMIASASLFVRRDLLNADGFSSFNFGINIGIGGELPLGLNTGVAASVSRSTYDAPLLLYSSDERQDWLGFARAYVGSRKLKFLGFSPSIDNNYSRVDSNHVLYEMSRHRVNFKFARYF
ncbi:surface lipoprotein assembly modifier [Parasphingorhabdus sp.]|uniref:surface lipoprotein assembly modifier n=1 Tax=Parasphingorhabdus sp. TaxID=2709688 RepID=UPI003593E2BE